MKFAQISMAMTAAMLFATTLIANSAEDPRMDRDAVVMATVCGEKTGCREMHVVGPYVDEVYGPVDAPIFRQWRMSVSSCGNMLNSGMGSVQVQRRIFERMLPGERISDKRCQLSDEKSI